MEKYNTRNDVPIKYRWDLTDFYKTKEDFYNEYEKVKNEFVELKKYKGKLKESEKLLEFLKKNVSIKNKIIDLYIYAITQSDEDLSNSQAKEDLGKIDELETNYSIITSFFKPELLSLTKEEYEKLFDNEKLLKYKVLLDEDYRYKEHVLDSEKEALVSSLTNTLSSYSQMSSTLLNLCHDYGKVIMDDGTEETLTNTNYRSLMQKLSREKRKQVYNQFNKVKKQYAEISAGLLNNYVKTEKTLANIYNYKTTWDSKLFDLRLSDKVFQVLIDACVENKDVIKKYWDLKAEVFNVDRIMPWDNTIKLYESDKEYTIEEAQKIVLEAIKPLGEDYYIHFKRLIDERCVDYCQYKGKCSGGYNISSSDKINSKILMSFNGNFESISTLIHEGGHFTNHQYMYENNDEIYSGNYNIVAEVASLTNECLLSNYFANSDNKKDALVGLSNLLSVIYSNLFGAVQEGDFEKEMYKYVENGGVLTKEFLCNLNEESLKKFYPIEELDSEYESISWVSRSHFYMFFYLLSYAVCISVAIFVSNEIIKGNKEMIEKYIKFLKTGWNVNITDTFKILGIDLEDKKIYESAIKKFDETIEEFKKLYNS